MSRNMNPQNKLRILQSPSQRVGCIVSMMISLLVGNPTPAAELEPGEVSISPSNPNEVWMAERALHPGESVIFHVDIAQNETHNGKNYELQGDIGIDMIGPNSLWTEENRNGNHYVTFEAVNTAEGAKNRNR